MRVWRPSIRLVHTCFGEVKIFKRKRATGLIYSIESNRLTVFWSLIRTRVLVKYVGIQHILWAMVWLKFKFRAKATQMRIVKGTREIALIFSNVVNKGNRGWIVECKTFGRSVDTNPSVWGKIRWAGRNVLSRPVHQSRWFSLYVLSKYWSILFCVQETEIGHFLSVPESIICSH